MGLIVQKFGGTSLATVAKIQAATRHVLRAKAQGHDVICVTSAMAGVTNELAAMAASLPHAHNAEHDALLTAGEQAATALFALALQQQGLKSRSWMAWQLPLQTDTTYGNAHLKKCHVSPLKAFLAEQGISVVAGFQGVTPDGRITSLGRGGSDTTALALASAFKADSACTQDVSCTIFTDVDGIHVADPRHVPHARYLSAIDYDTMYALAQTGARVLHPDCVRYAQKGDVPLRVTRTHGENDKEDSMTSGTWVRREASEDTAPFFLTHTSAWHLCESLGAGPISPATLARFLDELTTHHPFEAHLITPTLWALRTPLLEAKRNLLRDVVGTFTERPDHSAITVHLTHPSPVDVLERLTTDATLKDYPWWLGTQKAIVFVPSDQLTKTLGHLHAMLNDTFNRVQPHAS